MNIRVFAGVMMLGVTLLAAPEKKNPWPFYREQRVPRPEGLRTFQPDDFKPNPEFAAKMKPNALLPSSESFVEFAKYCRDNPDGQQRWENSAQYIASILNEYDFPRGRGSGADACYVVRLARIMDLARLYRLTGSRELGEFIRAHFLLAATLPMDFWIHAELRRYDPKRPVGGLETGGLAANLSFALALAGDVFPPEEYQRMLSVLRENTLIPCVRWLEDNKKLRNNWVASIASHTYPCALFLEDKEALKIARREIKRYVDTCFENDGSYAEGPGYMNYPISCLLPLLRLMSPEEAQEVFGSSGMRLCSNWLAYIYFYQQTAEKEHLMTVAHFGDNSYSASPRYLLSLADFYQDGVGAWLLNYFGVQSNRWDVFYPPRRSEIKLPKATSPEELHFPLVRAFDNGWGVMRSSWQPNGIVLSIKSGSAARIQYTHQRPELNSIVLAAYGEYFIVSCGSASLRAQLHHDYDMKSVSANLVTIDGKTQLMRRDGTILLAEEGILGRWFFSDAREGYHLPMKRARRAILFVKEPGYFVVVDQLRPEDGQPHQYNSCLHFNNRDEQAVLSQVKEGHWLCERPLANLHIFTAASGGVLDIRKGEGYMHGAGRDYSPGGRYEGKLGSSLTLDASNSPACEEMTFTTVLYPVTKEQSTPQISGTWNQIRVGDDIITVQDDGITLQQNGQTETRTCKE